MTTGIPRVKVPTSVHTDHLIVAREGAKADLEAAKLEHGEVYRFLESACQKYGLDFWRPGAGILHQIIFERYAQPGALLVGSDSHTPNAAGMAMLGIGVGGAEAVDVMVGLPYSLRCPKVIGVHLTGKLSGWTSAKDIILKLASILTVKGGTGSIIEYYGEGAQTLSPTAMSTIGNMGAEVGATTTIFPYNSSIAEYLQKTERQHIIDEAKPYLGQLHADKGCEYDQHFHIDLNTLEPHINGPYSPDISQPISKFAEFIKGSNSPSDISAALIGSCTNSSYEDLSRASGIAGEALKAGLKTSTSFFVAPGSEEIRATVDRDGIFDNLTQAGGTLLANACGACVGQWERPSIKPGTVNSIISSFNRNFAGRQDGNTSTHSFVASPEIATAMAFAGSLTFNPVTDSLPLPNGGSFKFSEPSGLAFPQEAYERSLDFYSGPVEDGSAVEVDVDASSERIQLLRPFPAWNGEDSQDLTTLIKVQGKCTTDHISPAGPWYRYRGHLENISQNLLIGAINADNGKPNSILNKLTGAWEDVPTVAAHYRDNGVKWAVVAGDNYGEGSSREAAALSPRYMGGFAVLAKSMARIHETNLKKQGLLPLFFTNSGDYDSISSEDKLRISGLKTLSPSKPLRLEIIKPDGTVVTTELSHTLTMDQVEWFKAGSALNTLRPHDAIWMK